MTVHMQQIIHCVRATANTIVLVVLLHDSHLYAQHTSPYRQQRVSFDCPNVILTDLLSSFCVASRSSSLS